MQDAMNLGAHKIKWIQALNSSALILLFISATPFMFKPLFPPMGMQAHVLITQII